MSEWKETSVEVRYQETDQMGIVYYANYLVWFEIGRTSFLKQSHLDYHKLEQAQGIYLPVIHVEIDYRMPAKYGDEVLVYTRIRHLTPVRIHFQYQIARLMPLTSNGEECSGHNNAHHRELLVRGETHHTWVNRLMKPLRLDRAAPAFYQELERLYTK